MSTIKAISLHDRFSGVAHAAEFHPVRRVDDAVYGHATFEADGSDFSVATCLFDDGTTFTTSDWQGVDSVAEGEDVESIRWVEAVTGAPAIFMNGLPRLLG